MSRPLGCRIITAASSDPFGQIDAISTGANAVTASGWIVDPDTTDPNPVPIYVDGRPNALAGASQLRPDVARVYPTAGPSHGYSLTMQASPGPHEIYLYAINKGPGSCKLLGCCRVIVSSSDPFAQINILTDGAGRKMTASGWTIDPDTASFTLIPMYIDGQANTVTLAKQTRADVAQAYPTAGANHGHTISMPANAGKRTVCIYAINIGPGKSTLLGCRAIVIR